MCNSLWGQIYSSELKGRLLTLHYITSLRAPVGPLFSSPNTPVLNLISSVSEFSPCLMLFEGFSSVTVKVIIQTEALSTSFGNSQQLRCGCFGRSLIKTWKSNSLEFQNNSSSAAISCYLGKIWTENETRQLLKKTFKLPTCIWGQWKHRVVLCRPRLLPVGSGSDQGGLAVLCLWDWLPVIVNLSPMLCNGCECLCVWASKRYRVLGVSSKFYNSR